MFPKIATNYIRLQAGALYAKVALYREIGATGHAERLEREIAARAVGEAGSAVLRIVA